MQNLKNLLLEWLKKTPHIAVGKCLSSSYGSKKTFFWNIAQQSNSTKLSLSSTDEAHIASFLGDYVKIDFKSSMEEWKHKGCGIDYKLGLDYREDLFYYLYERLDNKNEVLQLGNRLIGHKYLIEIAEKNSDVLKHYMQCKPYNFSGLLEHEEFDRILRALKKNYSGKEYEDILFNFLNHRKKQISRIESQILAKKFIPDDKRFDNFFNKIGNNATDKGNIFSFNLSKDRFYLEVNSTGRPIDKYRVTKLLIDFINFINHNKKRFDIYQAHVLNTQTGLAHYTIVFDCKSSQEDLKIDYQELLFYVMHDGDNAIGLDFHGKNKFFDASVNKYFIEKILPESCEKAITRVKKI